MFLNSYEVKLITKGTVSHKACNMIFSILSDVMPFELII